MGLFSNQNEPVQHVVSPTQLRAYERLTLLLERTTPDSMLSRMDDLTTLTPLEIERALLTTIRLEFDHNITQQIYVSDELWEQIENAREQMKGFIVMISKQLPPDISSADYAKALVTAYHNNGDTPHELALNMLKKEVRTLL